LGWGTCLGHLSNAPATGRASSKKPRNVTIMANIAKWNIRLRHEWLQSPLKKKRVKRSEKARIGLLDAENRKNANNETQGEKPQT